MVDDESSDNAGSEDVAASGAPCCCVVPRTCLKAISSMRSLAFDTYSLTNLRRSFMWPTFELAVQNSNTDWIVGGYGN